METKKNILSKSRYVRRDSKINNLRQMYLNASRNDKNKKNLNENNLKKNMLKKQLSHYILSTDYNRSKTNQIISISKSPSQIIIPNIIKKNNVSMVLSNNYIRRYTNLKINQPRTPFNNYSKNKNNVISERSFQRNIKAPLINTNNKKNDDYIKVNNLVYYIRCPYCNHELNKVDKNHYKTNIFENKENISENLLNNNNNNYKYKTEKKYPTRKILKEEKSNHKSFYVNERGVFVFEQNDRPISSVKIVNSKSDLSKYINKSKVLGKKNNIGIYEGPVPITKVFIRPLKIRKNIVK